MVCGPVDYDNVSMFILPVVVTDGGGLTDMANIMILVEDENDNAPIFLNTPFAISIPESTNLMSVVLAIDLTDQDGMANSDSQLYLLGNNLPFGIVGSNIVLTSASPPPSVTTTGKINTVSYTHLTLPTIYSV